MIRRPLTILLVEDDRVDAMAFRRAVERRGMANPLHVARCGREALARLRGEDGEPPLAPPYLVLLDQNTPGMSGHEFLDELRADEALADTVVFMLTSSDAEEDLMGAYRRNVAGYLLKPSVAQGFEPLLELLEAYDRTVLLPR